MYILIYFLWVCAFEGVVALGLFFENHANNGDRFCIVHLLNKGFYFGGIWGRDMFASFKGQAFSSAHTGKMPCIKDSALEASSVLGEKAFFIISEGRQCRHPSGRRCGVGSQGVTKDIAGLLGCFKGSPLVMISLQVLLKEDKVILPLIKIDDGIQGADSCAHCDAVLCMVEVFHLGIKMKNKMTVKMCRFNMVWGASDAKFCLGIVDLVDPG